MEAVKVTNSSSTSLVKSHGIPGIVVGLKGTPTELFPLICEQAAASDLLAVREVCKQWQALVEGYAQSQGVKTIKEFIKPRLWPRALEEKAPSLKPERSLKAALNAQGRWTLARGDQMLTLDESRGGWDLTFYKAGQWLGGRTHINGEVRALSWLKEGGVIFLNLTEQELGGPSKQHIEMLRAHEKDGLQGIGTSASTFEASVECHITEVQTPDEHCILRSRVHCLERLDPKTGNCLSSLSLPDEITALESCGYRQGRAVVIGYASGQIELRTLKKLVRICAMDVPECQRRRSCRITGLQSIGSVVFVRDQNGHIYAWDPSIGKEMVELSDCAMNGSHTLVRAKVQGRDFLFWIEEVRRLVAYSPQSLKRWNFDLPSSLGPQSISVVSNGTSTTLVACSREGDYQLFDLTAMKYTASERIALPARSPGAFSRFLKKIKPWRT